MTLQEKIENAFRHRQIPAEVVEMESCLQIDSDVEDAQWFKGRDWREITREDWRLRHWGLNFLSPEAFAYYLPSLLVLTIHNPRDYPDLAVHSFIMRLDRTPGIENFDPPLTDRFFGLSGEEFDAIKEWLVFACENVPQVFWGAAASGPGDGFGRAFDTIDLLQKESALQRMIDKADRHAESGGKGSA
jgi:hypothetical protein